MAITNIEAKILIDLIKEANIAQFFEKIDDYKVKTPEINQLRKEFISGSYGFDFYDRLLICVNVVAQTNFNLEKGKQEFSEETSRIAEVDKEQVEREKGTVRKDKENEKDFFKEISNFKIESIKNRILKNLKTLKETEELLNLEDLPRRKALYEKEIEIIKYNIEKDETELLNLAKP